MTDVFTHYYLSEAPANSAHFLEETNLGIRTINMQKSMKFSKSPLSLHAICFSTFSFCILPFFHCRP